MHLDVLKIICSSSRRHCRADYENERRRKKNKAAPCWCKNQKNILGVKRGKQYSFLARTFRKPKFPQRWNVFRVSATRALCCVLGKKSECTRKISYYTMIKTHEKYILLILLWVKYYKISYQQHNMPHNQPSCVIGHCGSPIIRAGSWLTRFKAISHILKEKSKQAIKREKFSLPSVFRFPLT